MTSEKTGFPEAEAWAATMSPLRKAFHAARRENGAVSDDAEYYAYAAIDLSNMGKAPLQPPR